MPSLGECDYSQLGIILKEILVKMGKFDIINNFVDQGLFIYPKAKDYTQNITILASYSNRQNAIASRRTTNLQLLNLDISLEWQLFTQNGICHLENQMREIWVSQRTFS